MDVSLFKKKKRRWIYHDHLFIFAKMRLAAYCLELLQSNLKNIVMNMVFPNASHPILMSSSINCFWFVFISIKRWISHDCLFIFAKKLLLAAYFLFVGSNCCRFNWRTLPWIWSSLVYLIPFSYHQYFNSYLRFLIIKNTGGRIKPKSSYNANTRRSHWC